MAIHTPNSEDVPDAPEHAAFAPSSAHRWMRCTASFYYHERIGESFSSYAHEGTVLHDIAKTLLRNEQYDASAYRGRYIENVHIGEEQVYVLQDYIDFILGLMKDFPDSQSRIEERVYIDPDCWGTVDSILVTPDVFHVTDLKTGRGVVVHPEHNEQLFLYGYGVLKSLDIDPLDGPFPSHAHLHIVQPRGHDHVPIKSYTVDIAEIVAFYEDEAKPAIEAIKNKDISFNPGVKQCQWCNYKPRCAALRDYIMAQAQIEFEAVLNRKPLPLKDPVEDITNEELAAAIRLIPLLEHWIKAIRTEGLSAMRRGEDIEGFKVVESSKHRKWTDDRKALQYLISKLGKGKSYTHKPLTPSQAEKALKKDPQLQSFIMKPTGDPTLALLSDKRPPMRFSAESEFKDYAKPADADPSAPQNGHKS